MQRRQFLRNTSAVLAAGLAGCGGGDGGSATQSNAGPAPPAPSADPLSGSLPTLTLHPTRSITGPYTAAVYPLQGLVPAGKSLDSPDDPSLRSAVISRWPDGSASVVIVAGETAVTLGSPKQVRMRAAAVTSASLTAARVGLLVSNVTVDFGPVGAATLSDFTTPSKLWWTNERVICCRYRVPVGSHPTLEAIVDIHAFSSNRALVEVVVENCKMVTATPVEPSAVSYSAAVAVNGATVATVQSANAPGGVHEAFRAWYASSWVGGDPGIEVTHDTESTQAHPLFFRVWKSGGSSMSEYAADAYQPWGVGRHPEAGMGGPGDSPFIGPLPQWEVQYLQTGNNQVRRAVIASALSVLSFNVNYRDSGTGLMPSFDQLANKDQQQVGYNPAKAWPNNGAEPAWEVAHHPAAGLLAFMCHPSPVFIEIAQKIAVWNGTWGGYNGAFGTYYQTRGKAWCMRSLAHAIFLTPDADAWKQAGRSALFRTVQLLKTFQDDPKSALGFVWGFSPSNISDFAAIHGGRGFIQPLWEHHFLVTEIHKVANAKLLAGAEQSALMAIADWAAAQPIRYINESYGGEWRILYYLTPAGRSPTTIDSLPTWGQQFAWSYNDAPPPPVSGPWMTGNGSSPNYASARIDNTAGAYYPSSFWAALVAAVERGLPGADAAWTKVINNVTNLSTWSAGFADDPRWGAYPRNK